MEVWLEVAPQPVFVTVPIVTVTPLDALYVVPSEAVLDA